MRPDRRRAVQVPLIVALTLFAHRIRRSGVSYLASQTSLGPRLAELMLGNHV